MSSENGQPSPCPTPGATRLVESFTRLIAVYGVPPLMFASQLADLDRMTVPFRNGVKPLWEPLAPKVRAAQGEYLLPWVRTYLCGDADAQGKENPAGPDCEARAWRANVLDRIGRKLVVSRGRETFGIDIAAVEFYLFSTGIGILVIDCELTSAADHNASELDLGDLIRFNYAAHYVAPDIAAIVRRQPRPAGHEGARPADPEAPPTAESASEAARLIGALESAQGTTFGDIAAASLAPLLASSATGLLDRRAFRVQSFARVANTVPLEQLAPEFYCLRRVATPSYPAAPMDLHVQTSGEIVRTFDNIAIGCCLEGMTVLVVDRGLDFHRQMAHRVRRSYFAHYLLALHQRATLLVLALDAGRLPSVVEAGRTEDPTFQETVAVLRKRAIDFTFRHRFSQLSTMTHYAVFYETLTRQLRIPELLDEVRDELAELDEVLNFYQSRVQQERAEAEQAREAAEAARDRRLQQMIAILGPFSVLLALYGSNLPAYQPAAPGWTSPAVTYPALVWLAVTIGLLLLLRPPRRK